jgi:guanylate kinase
MSETAIEIPATPAPALLVSDDEAPEMRDYVRRPTPPLLVVLSGPSGVGKDVTLARMRELGYPFHYAVTATTRPQRPEEVDGVDYHFKTVDEFQQMLRSGQLLESAEVYGHFYGIPKSEVTDHLARGEDVIVKPDVQGAATIKRQAPQAVFIFLAPPSFTEQAERLRRRKTEDPNALAARLRIAGEEMRALPNFDYVVVNRTGKLNDTVREIIAILTAEKCRVRPRQINFQERNGVHDR